MTSKLEVIEGALDTFHIYVYMSEMTEDVTVVFHFSEHEEEVEVELSLEELYHKLMSSELEA